MFTVGWDVTVYVLYQNSSVYVYSRVGCYMYYIRTAVCTFTVVWDVMYCICTISEHSLLTMSEVRNGWKVKKDLWKDK